MCANRWRDCSRLGARAYRGVVGTGRSPSPIQRLYFDCRELYMKIFHPTVPKFNKVVQRFLPQFEKEVELGYYSFIPEGPYKKVAQVTAQDILSAVRIGSHPRKIRLGSFFNSKCFIPLLPGDAQPPGQKFDNLFPFDPGVVVPMHVAMQRSGFDLLSPTLTAGNSASDNRTSAKDKESEASLNFVLGGGSILDMLDTRQIQAGAKFLVQRHRNLLFVKKHELFQQDYTDPGFQFERLVCGYESDEGEGDKRKRVLECLAEKNDTTRFSRIQVLRIGGHRCLTSAECDAVTALPPPHGLAGAVSPVELKISDPRYWQRKVALQMVSSGSLDLVHGIKRKFKSNNFAS